MGRETSARQEQAHPLGWKDIKEFIEGAGESLRADRERAMLCVAYETLARRAELVTLEVCDIDFHPNGTGHALMRRGKTDAEGQGEGRVSVAGDGEMAEGVAGTLGNHGGGGISSADRTGSNRRAPESREHCAHLQAGGAVDWNARARC
jgi:integrase/recombinase XerD